MARLFPSNIGLKTMNYLDIEEKLQKNLRLIEKAMKKEATDAEIVNSVNEIMKNAKTITMTKTVAKPAAKPAAKRVLVPAKPKK